MDKKIEEMKKDLIEIFDEEYEKRRLITPQNTAEKMTAKGYRKQEWISVDERLPENEGSYLVYDIGQFRGKSTPNIKITHFKKGDKYHDYMWKNHFTHWMPLPEAPKIKGGAE